jgi:hypothetical protein
VVAVVDHGAVTGIPWIAYVEARKRATSPVRTVE